MKLLLLLVTTGLLSGCLPFEGKSELAFTAKPIKLTEGEEVDPDAPVTFELLKEKILIPKCIVCHKGFADEKKVLKKVEPGNPEESELFQSVQDGSMPKDAPVLSSLELAMVRKYIADLKP
jgi:hypothetical protein